MNYIFPYDLVEKGSKVALYGFGKVGKDFFEQLILKNYCQCVLCVDKCFESYEKIEKPFGKIGDLLVVKYDYLIIAVEQRKVVDEIIEKLKVIGVDTDKIIWSPFYSMKSIWPNNKQQYLQNPNFYISIVNKYRIANSIYGGGEFYQSYSEIGIAGTRNIQERLDIYQVKKYIKMSDSVLDIGCNCGFLDLQLGRYAGKVKGIDVEPKFIDIANETKKYVGRENVEFCLKDFQTEYDDNIGKYNVVFALAVHTNVFQTGVSEKKFVEEILGLLEQDGILFFESHNLINDRERFDRLCKLFYKDGMKLLHRENYFSDFDRDIVVMQKG